MADNDDTDFSTLMALGVGTTIGYKNYKKNRLTPSTSSSLALDPRSSIISKIQSLSIDPGSSKFNKQFALQKLDLYQQSIRANKIAGLGVKNAQLGTDMMATSSDHLIRTEWESAVRSVYPNPLEAKAFSSSTNAFEAIKMNIVNSSSVLTQRAFRLFSQNVEKLIGRGFSTSAPYLEAKSFINQMPQINALTNVSLDSLGSMSGSVQSISESLGGNLRGFHRGVKGQGEFVFRLAGQEKNLFTLPESFSARTGLSQGLIRTGNALDIVRAPGLFGIVNEGNRIGETLNFGEMKARRISELISTRGFSADSAMLQSEVSKLSEDMMKFGDYTEANVRSMEFSPETIYKSHQITALKPTGELVTGEGKRELVRNMFVETGGKFSPASSKGRFSLFDEKELYGVFGADVDTSRKPWQAFRQYRSAGDLSTAGLGAEFDFLRSPTALNEFNNGGARIKTLYLSEPQIYELQKMGITIGDGELLLHNQVKNKLQSSRITKVALNELNRDIALKFMGRNINVANITEQLSFDPLHVEGILGRSPEGRIISTGMPTEIVGMAPDMVTDMAGTERSALNLYMKETIQMSDTEKVFGGLKGMARFVGKDSYKTLGDALAKLGFRGADLRGVQAIARASDIKDTARAKQGLLSSFLLQANRANLPYDVASLTAQMSAPGMSVEGAKNLLQGLAPEFNLLTKETGGVGVTELFFGGQKSLTGAGNVPRLDPRIFSLLEASNPGGEGSNITADLMSRIAAANPERLNISSELLKSLKSFTGDVTPGQGDFILGKDALFDREAKNRLFREGGFIETGLEKSPHIYVPGYEKNPTLFPRLTDKGSVVDTSEVSKIYRGLVGDVRSFRRGGGKGIDEIQMMANIEAKKTGYLTRIFQEAAIAGHGAGSMTRGQVPGAMALTAMSEVNPADQGAFARSVASHVDVPTVFQNRIVGLPKKYALQMFDDMATVVGESTITAMKTKFLQGDLVAGMVMRHPNIGPYSMQPALFKMVNHEGENILIQEQLREVMIDGKTKYFQDSILTGLAADKDADTVSAFLLDPKTEASLGAQMRSETSALAGQMTAYRDHSIRMQMLKPKGLKGIPDEKIPIAERRAAEAAKLGMTKEEVGILSTNLTKSRTAVVASSLVEADKLRALSLLEWLEQQPISGKHLDVSKILSGVFEDQMLAINTAASGNADLMAGTVRSMMEGSDPTMLGLLDKGANVEGLGYVGGMELNQTSRNIANSIMEMKALPTGAQLRAGSKYTAPSSGASIGYENIKDVIFANEIRSTSKFAQGSRNVIASINQGMASAARRARPFMKPAIAGLAAAGVAAAIFSDPTSVMAPPSRSSANNREQMEIPGITQPMGEPTAAPQVQQKVAQLSTEGAERRKGFRVKIKSSNMSDDQRTSLAERLNSRFSGSKINMTVKDNRRSMNPQNISDIIENT